MGRTYLKDVVKEGDFIEYFPNTRRFTLLEGFGVDGKHIFRPAKVRLWQVLAKTENVEIIPTESVGQLKMCGKDAYLNVGGILREICKYFVNPGYALFATNLGAGFNTYDCLSPFELEENLENGYVFYPFNDFSYLKECELFKKGKALLNGVVWLPSRTIRVSYSGKEPYYFLMLRVLTGSTVVERIMAEFPKNSKREIKEYSEEFGICPDVVLANNIGVAGGNGTKGNPYKLLRYPY